MPHRTLSAAAIGILIGAAILTTAGSASAAEAVPAAAASTAVRGDDPDLCAPAVAAAIYGLGAAALTTVVAAAIASGAAEITIVGYTLTTGQWSQMAAAIGSFSAVEALVEQYIC